MPAPDRSPASTPPSASRPAARAWVRIGLILLAVIGLAFTLDGTVESWLVANRTKPLKNLAGEISEYGNWPSWMAIGGLALVIAWRLRARSAARLLLVMLVASTLAGMVANVARVTTGRARPNAKTHQGWHGPHLAMNKLSSFPSAHTSTTAGFFAPLLLLAGSRRRRTRMWNLSAVLPVAAVAASRVYLGAHHLSDVVTGMATGFVCALVVDGWHWPTAIAGRLNADRTNSSSTPR